MRPLLLCLVALASGCATTTTLGGATTVPAGKLEPQTTLDIGVAGERRSNGQPQLRMTVGARYGLLDGVDISARIGGLPTPKGAGYLHYGGDVKFQLERGDNYDLATALAVEYDRVNMGGALMHGLNLQVPLLVGLHGKQGREKLLVPRLALQHAWSSGAHPITKGLVGASYGVSYPLGKNRRTRVTPTIGWMWSTIHAESSNRLTSMWVWQAGIGFRRAPKPPEPAP